MTELEKLRLKYWNLYVVIDCEHASDTLLIRTEYSDKKYVKGKCLELLALADHKYIKAIKALDQYFENERTALTKL